MKFLKKYLFESDFSCTLSEATTAQHHIPSSDNSCKVSATTAKKKKLIGLKID